MKSQEKNRLKSVKSGIDRKFTRMAKLWQRKTVELRGVLM